MAMSAGALSAVLRNTPTIVRAGCCTCHASATATRDSTSARLCSRVRSVTHPRPPGLIQELLRDRESALRLTGPEGARATPSAALAGAHAGGTLPLLAAGDWARGCTSEPSACWRGRHIAPAPGGGAAAASGGGAGCRRLPAAACRPRCRISSGRRTRPLGPAGGAPPVDGSAALDPGGVTHPNSNASTHPARTCRCRCHEDFTLFVRKHHCESAPAAPVLCAVSVCFACRGVQERGRSTGGAQESSRRALLQESTPLQESSRSTGGVRGASRRGMQRVGQGERVEQSDGAELCTPREERWHFSHDRETCMERRVHFAARLLSLPLSPRPQAGPVALHWH